MDKVFISYHFDDNAKRIAAEVKDLLRYHGLQYMDGERLGGAGLADEIKNRIIECDGLVCLMTERAEELNSDWVRDERAFANARGKRTIAVAHNAVVADGMYTGNERIVYDPANAAEALLELSKNIGMWKQLSGRKLVIRLEPQSVADFVNDHREEVVVEYRLYVDSNVSPWEKAKVRPRGDAVLAWLSGIKTEDTDVELRIRYGDKRFKSRVESQYFRIKLEEEQ